MSPVYDSVHVGRMTLRTLLRVCANDVAEQGPIVL
jgi:hypothetical protein